MKRFLLVLVPVLFLALLLVPSTPASAASAVCVADPSVGPIGTVFTITCTGFAPNEPTTAWLTEPDGHVLSVPGVKADKTGLVTYLFPTKLGSGFAVALGEWALTVEGAQSQVLGLGRANVGGGTEGVKGAVLTANGLNVVGSGFEPGEIVDVWFDFPNGDCSGSAFGLSPIGMSTLSYGNFQADSAGDIAFRFVMPAEACNGAYHVVARGGKSGLGADTYVGLTGNPVVENASLVPDPATVLGVGGLISFFGTGFGPHEPVTCWETSPQGGAILTGTTIADNVGHFTVGLITGFGSESSEGALGEWAMTCKGEKTGAIGIARFTLASVMVDP